MRWETPSAVASPSTLSSARLGRSKVSTRQPRRVLGLSIPARRPPSRGHRKVPARPGFERGDQPASVSAQKATGASVRRSTIGPADIDNQHLNSGRRQSAFEAKRPGAFPFRRAPNQGLLRLPAMSHLSLCSRWALPRCGGGRRHPGTARSCGARAPGRPFALRSRGGGRVSLSPPAQRVSASSGHQWTPEGTPH